MSATATMTAPSAILAEMAPPLVADPTDDTALLARYCQGRGAEEAFAVLVERHARVVDSACRRILGHGHPLHEDACQATFLLLARKAPGLHGEGGLGAWLYAAARRVAANLRRGEERRRRREVSVAQAPVVTDAILQDPVTSEIDSALATLSHLQRQAVVGHFIEGKPHAQLAAELGVSEGALKKRTSDALGHLRSFFQRRGVPVGAAALAAVLAEAQAAEPGLVAACAAAPTRASTVARDLCAEAAGRSTRWLIAGAALLAIATLLTAFALLARSAPAPAPAPVAAVAAAPMEADPGEEAILAVLRCIRANDVPGLLAALDPAVARNIRDESLRMLAIDGPVIRGFDDALAIARGERPAPARMGRPLPEDLRPGATRLAEARLPGPLGDLARSMGRAFLAWADLALPGRDPTEAARLRTDCLRAWGVRSAAELRALDPEESLRRSGRVLAAIKAAYGAYGLDIDRSLAGAAIAGIEGTGDDRVALLTFTAFDERRTLPLPIHRSDGHWRCPSLAQAVTTGALGAAMALGPKADG